MVRPPDSTQPHRTTHVTPYQIVTNPKDLPERGSSNGGVFHRSQLVWLPEMPEALSGPHTVVGFVEGVGHVIIDARVLRPADLASTHAEEANEDQFALVPAHSR